jgi:hypothetical protein
MTTADLKVRLYVWPLAVLVARVSPSTNASASWAVMSGCRGVIEI